MLSVKLPRDKKWKNEFLTNMEIYQKKTNWRVRGTLTFQNMSQIHKGYYLSASLILLMLPGYTWGQFLRIMSVYPYPGSRGPFSKYTYYEIDRVYGLIRFFSSLTRLRLWNPGYSISDAVLNNGTSLLIVVELLEPTEVKIYSLQKKYTCDGLQFNL